MSQRSASFGYRDVPLEEKPRLVRGVFDRVASRYDLMNDLMSAGLHRIWKRFAVNATGVRAGMRVLDLAGGTGDLARLFADRVGPGGEVVLTDINREMLAVGRDRLLDLGLALPVLQCDAEKLPFPDNHFDIVTVAFGLRNMTHKDSAIAEMRRVLRPGGRVLILEMTKPRSRAALVLARLYLGRIVPAVSRVFTRSKDSSTLMHYFWDTIENCVPPATIEAALADVKTVLWNGPLGVFEIPSFAHGTKTVARFLADRAAEGAKVIIGGGDSVAAITQQGLADKMTHISTGGGASLEFLEGRELPGVTVLLDREGAK